MLVFFCISYFFAVFCSVRAKKIKEKGTHPHFDVPVSPYPWVGAIIALTRWLLLPPRRASYVAVQLPAPASSLAVPPPAASTAEAVDLSAGAAILEDPGPAAASTAT